jgi:ubiquinone/menaquinone biosynthesis C-methylase UbiE
VFSNIDIAVLFPDLQTRVQLQELWKEFFALMKELGKSECSRTDVDRHCKGWVRSFTSVYQKKDVTPYMHAFAMHISEFLKLHGNISMFSQQGLEKLNDITTSACI